MAKGFGQFCGLGICLLLAIGSIAQAGTINIILSDMDVSYLGNANKLYDSTAQVGGNLVSTEADPLETAVFEVDGNMVPGGVIPFTSDNMWGDLSINGLPASLPLNSFLSGIGSNGNVFGFDWFTSSGFQLRLGIDKIDALLTPGVFFFSGPAKVLSQNLPFGLAFGQDVVISYTATLPAISLGASSPTAMASGALTISGVMAPMVPEPSAMLLLACGMLAIPFARRRS